MKRVVLVGAGVLVALIAAPVLWLSLGDDGERRVGALTAPSAAAPPVGSLILNGSKTGQVKVPVHAFSLGAKVPTSSTGLATGKLVLDPIEILHSVDSSSPQLFKMLTTNESVSSATLAINATNANGETYQPVIYTFESGLGISNWDDGTTWETVVLRPRGIAVQGNPATQEGPAPVALMRAPSLRRDPILLTDFSAGVSVPFDASTGTATGKRQHKPVTVSHRLDDGSADAFHTSLQQNKNLGTVTIEVFKENEAGERFPAATYVYSNASLRSLEDSGASGNEAQLTQKATFTFSAVEVTVGRSTASDNLAVS